MNDDAPIRPSTETNVLLGRLEAKVDAFKDEQAASRGEMVGLRSDITTLSADVAVLKSQQRRPTPWWSVAAGIGAIAAVIVAVLPYLHTT